MADAELARQKGMDRERQKAHDQKLRGESFFSVHPVTVLGTDLTTLGWLSREKKSAATE
jgi:hypothetical protein